MLSVKQISLRRKRSQENALLVGRTSRGLTSRLKPVLAGFLPPSAQLVKPSSVGLASPQPLFLSGWRGERNHPTEPISKSPTFLPCPLKAALSRERNSTCSESLEHGHRLPFQPSERSLHTVCLSLFKSAAIVTKLRSRLAHPQKVEAFRDNSAKCSHLVLGPG